MKIDTEIRHVTKPGANIFLELGFPPAEAKRLHAALIVPGLRAEFGGQGEGDHEIIARH